MTRDEVDARTSARSPSRAPREFLATRRRRRARVGGLARADRPVRRRLLLGVHGRRPDRRWSPAGPAQTDGDALGVGRRRHVHASSEAERDEPGTTITLHLKPADAEHGLRDYTSAARDQGRSSSATRTSSRTRSMSSRGCGRRSRDSLNSMKAIWDRPKAEVTEDEYKRVLPPHLARLDRSAAHHPGEDGGHARGVRAALHPGEGAVRPVQRRDEARAAALRQARVRDGRVQGADAGAPAVRASGVVDAHDLSLNVSREILQKDRQIQVIRKQLVKKVLGDARRDEARPAPTTTSSSGRAFGPVLKEGLLASETQDKDKLLDLVVAPSTHDAERPTSLADYVGRMKEGQDAIYFLTGPVEGGGRAVAAARGVRRQGLRGAAVLRSGRRAVARARAAFKGKPLRVDRRAATSSSAPRRSASRPPRRSRQAARSRRSAHQRLRVHLQDDVKEVRLSSRLTSSPACLVADEHDLTPRMQRMLEQLGQRGAEGQADPRAQPGPRADPEAPVDLGREQRRSAARALRQAAARPGPPRRLRAAPRPRRVQQGARRADAQRRVDRLRPGLPHDMQSRRARHAFVLGNGPSSTTFQDASRGSTTRSSR